MIVEVLGPRHLRLDAGALRFLQSELDLSRSRITDPEERIVANALNQRLKRKIERREKWPTVFPAMEEVYLFTDEALLLKDRGILDGLLKHVDSLPAKE